MMNPEYAYKYCTPSSTRRLLSKAVVSLNNSGASLLERARYNEAKTTIKDALDLASLLRKAPLSADADVQRRQDSLSRMNTALHRAEQHLARPASSCTGAAGGEQQHQEPPPTVQVTVLSNDDASDAMETAASDFCSSLTMFAVRILDEDDDDDDDYCCIDDCYVFSVLLLNYSVACQCPRTSSAAGDEASISSSSQQQDSSFFNRVQANKRYQQAWPVCHLAHELLSRHRLPTTTTTAAIPETQRRFVLLHMLVVSNLMHLAFELGKRRHGHKFYDKLCRLREELPPQTPTRMDGVDESFLHSRRTAPAA